MKEIPKATRETVRREIRLRGLPYITWRRGSFFYLGLPRFSYAGKGSRKGTIKIYAGKSWEQLREQVIIIAKRQALGMGWIYQGMDLQQ